MERIKQALEKARQEREMTMGNAVPTRSTPANGAEPTSMGSITYTQTQSINVPRHFLRSQRIISGPDDGPLADTYNVLRTKVLQRIRDQGWRAIAVTSPRPGEGKTLTAINLAISLSMGINWTVLLVDVDLRRPSIHTFFGLKPAYGLADHLTDSVPLEQMLIHPGLDSLVLLPGGKSLPNSSELLGSTRMAQLVEEFKNRYPTRLVLFDMPSVLSTADALAFSPYVDAVLLVAEEGRTQSEDLARSMTLLKDTPILGTVLNKATEAAPRS